MTRNLILTIACGVGLTLGSALQAQTTTSGSGTAVTTGTGSCPECHKHWHHHRGFNLQKLTKELNLTQDQQTAIQKVLTAAHTQAKAIRENTSLAPEQKKAQLKDVFQGVKGQVDGILTDAQKAQLAQMRASHHHHGQEAPATSGSNQ